MPEVHDFLPSYELTTDCAICGEHRDEGVHDPINKERKTILQIIEEIGSCHFKIMELCREDPRAFTSSGRLKQIYDLANLAESEIDALEVLYKEEAEKLEYSHPPLFRDKEVDHEH